ncbi:hypothetical protein Ae201684P_017334, partial [Aphanomyces euteiches]
MSKGISIPKPDVGFSQVASVFGSLSLAYGAGIVIPALQREHSEPSRMIRVIVITLGTISVLFLLVAVTGVAYVGCQIPGNAFSVWTVLSDLLDFAGASCTSLCNMILPIGFSEGGKKDFEDLMRAACVSSWLGMSRGNGKVLSPAKRSGPAPWDSVKFPALLAAATN